METNKKPGPLVEQRQPGLGNIDGREFTPFDNSSESQRTRILAWLLTVGPLSTLQARSELDVLHPAARVQELRKAGHRIVTHWRTDENGSGRPHHVASYVLLAGKQGGQAHG